MAQAAVPQDGLFRLEPRTAIATEAGGGLRLVEQTREDVHRELGGAEVDEELAGQRLLTGRSALGEPLHWSLDPPQPPNVRTSQGNGSKLGLVELARRRALRRGGRCGRSTVSAAVAAAGCDQRHRSDGKRGSRKEEPRHPDRAYPHPAGWS